MPELFGRYELHDLLGRGGMGEVYRAVDTVRDRTVALKLLPKHLAVDDSFQTRFRRESQMAARLNDPHIIPIHDFGEIDGQLFIDMRLVEGRDLGSVLAEQGRLPVATAVTILAQVAGALQAAHQAGLVHRDVKPSNVLLSGWTPGEEHDPFAYLVDFGIARAANQEGTALTATTGTVGTVAYMSPERIGGSPGDRRTDIYALGCVLFEAVTGQKPFDGEMFAIMYAHMNTAPPRASDRAPGVPRALDDVIARAMAKDPDQRYATAAAFALAARQAVRGGQGAAVPTAVPGHPTPTGYGPSGPVPSGPVPSGPIPSGPVPSGPPAAARPDRSTPAAPAASGGLPAAHPSAPLPQYFAPSAPPAPSGPPGPPPGPSGRSHSSGPLGTTPTAPRSGGGSKRGLLLGAGALVVVIGVVLAIVLSSGGSGTPAAHSSSSTGARSSTTSAAPASYRTGGPGTPSVSWQHFGSFAQLVGTRNGDSAHAFQDASCSLSAKQSNEPDSILDEITCSYPGSPVVAEIARFKDTASARALVTSLITQAQYAASAVSIAGRVVGLQVTSPASAKDADSITYLCGLPQYAVQFYAPDQSKPGASPTTIQNNFWQPSEFPDVVPDSCNTDFSGPAAGSTPTTSGAGAPKQPADLPTTLVKSLVNPDHLSDSHLALSKVIDGTELAVAGTAGSVTFWKYDTSAHTLQLAAVKGYPYKAGTLDTSNLTVQSAVLAGMTHATFIVHGTFSTDGTGNAVAYSYDVPKQTWGAIKAETRTSLQVTDQGVAPGGIGLSQNFRFVSGRLETDDCSSTVPASQCGPTTLVTKFWEWDGTHFVLHDTAGLAN
ncbi:MAG: protein kinase domain-containing protein [Jatrophihabitans sp.]|uniref:serine/threonine-protein kinase n=1 Tax=Jatrophihabitans sp. TaxID=1932789 RepID=UPI003F7E2BE8